MRLEAAVTCSLLAGLLSGCGGDAASGPDAQVQGFRVVNAYTQPVDVFVDGDLAVSAVAPGDLDSVPQDEGEHTVSLRPSGTSVLVTLRVRTEAGAMRTIAAVRVGGTMAASTLDDTNAVVPAGATKVRVLHLAPNAGEIQVFRTQPDWGTTIEWQFPFLYDSSMSTPLLHPYFQSTVGVWDIRAWRKPSEVSLGWEGTTARVSFDLASGEKRTVLVLDKPGGGIRLSVLDQ